MEYDYSYFYFTATGHALLLWLYGIQYILSNCVEIVHRHFTPPLYMPRKRLLFSRQYTSLYNLDKTYYLIVTRQYTRFVYVGQYSNIILHVYSKYKQGLLQKYYPMYAVLYVF